MTPPPKPAVVSPSAWGVSAHCRRTAAVAKLIAHHLFLPAEEKDLLSAACLLHHSCTGLLAPRTMERLLADVGGEGTPAPVIGDPVPSTVRRVLNAFDCPGSGTALELRLAAILRLADAFDQNMEAQPIDGEHVGEILDRLRDGVEAGLWPEESIDALAQAARPSAIGPAESWRVPFVPQAALHTLTVMRDPCASLADVVAVAGQDPATAGLVMRLANSALFGSRTRASTLSGAIGRLGFATAQRVITAAALRPLFDSPRLQAAWRHALQVADLSEQLANRAGAVDPAEAYLAGLVHDVGQMALLTTPLYDAARIQGMVIGGCNRVYAENLLLRTDHAALGAQIAVGWRLPETMVTAIQYHHRPEQARSPLASLLYVAEDISGSEEDLPSLIRLEAATRGLGLTEDEVDNCTVSALGNWLAAA